MSQVEWNIGSSAPKAVEPTPVKVKVTRSPKAKPILLCLVREKKWDEADKQRGLAVLKADGMKRYLKSQHVSQ